MKRTQLDEEKLAALHKSGRKVGEIARQVGVKPHVVEYRLRVLGLLETKPRVECLDDRPFADVPIKVTAIAISSDGFLAAIDCTAGDDAMIVVPASHVYGREHDSECLVRLFALNGIEVSGSVALRKFLRASITGCEERRVLDRRELRGFDLESEYRPSLALMRTAGLAERD